MNRLIPFLVVLVLALAAFSQSQSLQELAKKEKERREKLAATAKSITNEDAAKYKNAAVTTGQAPVVADPQEQKKPGDPANPESKPAAEPKSDEPVDFEGRPESFWKQTFADARQKIKDLDNESNVIVLKLNDLQNRFYKEADGFRQQEIQREIQKTIYEQDQNKDELAKAKKQLEDLDKEARKSGALPGWIK